jgi:thiamine pyrophosphate-dependent acetolactate synthase large subunit-like protein
LKGRGALQDIDQMALMKPNVKWAAAARTVREIAPTLERPSASRVKVFPGRYFWSARLIPFMAKS